ncbi:Serine/threonine-protein phosphatase 6 regulatory ankyrin repeat subunit A [Phytophthora nicotianae]|uniref:Serine/threonine-protein phosphatase 6 regulatory ankyrin repeat subunit A n=1 Tax=Phytophthora nicotianae TaxID=4792 RepID=A0A0W8C471_PHYNI|nr:Serine/threonine-protein phosphatase 6 regulatory ankyrin repeat subunit A [Phytophthora nicotianae]
MKIRVRFLVGNVCSFLSLVLLLAACSGHKWARDAANSVDIGLWYLTGAGVRYKLINAGAEAGNAEGSSADQVATYYRAFCDPWCLGDATATRFFIVLALIGAIVSFTLSVMVAFDIKIPTWNGEGKEATLVTPVVCSLIETVTLIPAVALWKRMVMVYDNQCRETMHINTFTCIEMGPTHTYAIAAIPFAAATYLLWRLSHSYHNTDACFLPYADIVDEILSGIANKIDIDANGSDGRNALHWACTLHRTSICHVLLKKGASISKKDRDGWTPLHWASRVGNLDIVRLLAKYGTNLNVQDRWGTTPLMLTVVGESKIAAETLIELGASVDARNVGFQSNHSLVKPCANHELQVFGQTPLMLCAEGGASLHQLGMVFLNAGSNLSLQDAQGMTALHYAAACGSGNLLMNMLQQCDAELVDKPNKILDLVKNWREGNLLVAFHDDDDDSEANNSTGSSEDDGSDDSSEEEDD